MEEKEGQSLGANHWEATTMSVCSFLQTSLVFKGNKHPLGKATAIQGALTQAAEPDPCMGLSFCCWDWCHSEYVQSLHGLQRVVHVATHFYPPLFLVPSTNMNKN